MEMEMQMKSTTRSRSHSPMHNPQMPLQIVFPANTSSGVLAPGSGTQVALWRQQLGVVRTHVSFHVFYFCEFVGAGG